MDLGTGLALVLEALRPAALVSLQVQGNSGVGTGKLIPVSQKAQICFKNRRTPGLPTGILKASIVVTWVDEKRRAPDSFAAANLRATSTEMFSGKPGDIILDAAIHTTGFALIVGSIAIGDNYSGEEERWVERRQRERGGSVQGGD